MTAPEFVQMKAFARIDGALLSVLWIVSFGFYILGLATPGYTLAALILALTTPFLVGSRLKRFRDNGLDGHISFLRGWAYVVYMFFYGSLLFAIAQWAYFTYMDNGHLIQLLSQMMATPENEALIKQMGLGDTLNASLEMMGNMRPIDLSLNMLTTNIALGIVMGMPLAAIVQKREIKRS